MILYGALAEAVKRESAQAVANWFGVGPFTVWKCRKALSVGSTTPGTLVLRSRWAPETCQSDVANEKREPALHSPERVVTIAAARRGKKRPAHVVEALRRANLGKRASKATRRKMSDAPKQRGTVRRQLAGHGLRPKTVCSASCPMGTLPSGRGGRSGPCAVGGTIWGLGGFVDS